MEKHPLRIILMARRGLFYSSESLLRMDLRKELRKSCVKYLADSKSQGLEKRATFTGGRIMLELLSLV